MIKSKIIELLKTFSIEELKGFRDFVHSPYHNKNKKVRILFESIKKSFPKFENDKLEKENLYSFLYPGKPYNDVVMRILISDLLKLGEEYLAYLKFKKNIINEKKFLLTELKERKLDSLFRKNLKHTEEILYTGTPIDTNYFNELHNLQNIKIDFLISCDKQMDTAEDVLKQGEFLIYFSLISLLNIAHELKMQESVLNINFENNIVNEFTESLDIDRIFSFIENNNSEYAGIVSIYYYLYKSYTYEEDDKYYFKLKECVESQFNRFNREEKFNLLIVMESICSSKVSHGKTEFYKHLMDIYNMMLSESIWGHSETSIIQINLFRNIFYTAVILGKYEWAADFVENYKDRLVPEQRENMINFSRAILFFELKDFEKALEGINKVNYNFFVFKFDARVLSLKIYFELSMHEQLYSMIDSFSHFLANNKNVFVYDKERFGKFLKYIKLILKLQDSHNEDSINMLKNELETDSAVINKRWLREKLENLRQNNIY